VKLYDAHNHLQDDRFAERQMELLADCAEVGVVRVVVNGACECDWSQVRALARAHPIVLPSFGYHPWYLHERTADWQKTLAGLLQETGGAVGEIGLDRWKPGLSYENQEAVFLAQLRLAAEWNRPVSIHCLQAWGRLQELMRENPRPACGWVLHSFGGSMEIIPGLARLGAYFSFPGYFLHERKHRQREIFKHVPRNRLLIETDSPDQLLPPELNRFPLAGPDGKPLNHPANLVVIYQELAKFLEIEPPALAAQVEENFLRIFGVCNP
jgi:TatD DNase family protein